MAKLGIVETGPNHIKVIVDDFDETYDDTVRNIHFLIKETDTYANYTPVWITTIPILFDGAFEYTFSSLTESTEYSIRIVISNIKSASDQYLEATRWTNDPKPLITKFHCSIDEGEAENIFNVSCHYTVLNTSIFGATKFKFFWRVHGETAWIEFGNEDAVKNEIEDEDGVAIGRYIGRAYSDTEAPKFDFMMKVTTNDNTNKAIANGIEYTRNIISFLKVEPVAEVSAFGDFLQIAKISISLRRIGENGTVSFEISDANGTVIKPNDAFENLEQWENVGDGEYLKYHQDDFFGYRSPFTCTVRVDFNDIGGFVKECQFGYPEYVPFIRKLTCTQRASGEKTVTVSFATDYITVDESIYQIWASQKNGEPWCKAQGTISSNQTKVDVSVDNYGEYTFTVYVYNGDLHSQRSTNVELLEIEKPKSWNWTSDMSREYLELDANFEVHPVTHAEWNSFLDLINQVRVWFSNGSNYAPTGAYAFSQRAGAGDEFTPQMYNEAVEAIQSIAGGGYAGFLLK